MYTYLFISALALSISFLHAADSSSWTPAKEDDPIEIAGVSKPMIGHINNSLIWTEGSDTFSTTRIFRYQEKNFIEKGDIMDIEYTRVWRSS